MEALRGSYGNNDCIIHIGIPNNTIYCAAMVSAAVYIANREEILSYFYEKETMDKDGCTDECDLLERGEMKKMEKCLALRKQTSFVNKAMDCAMDCAMDWLAATFSTHLAESVVSKESSNGSENV